MDFSLKRFVIKNIFSAAAVWFIFEPANFRTEVLDKYLDGKFELLLSYVIGFFVFYFISSEFEKGIDKGSIVILPLFYAVTFGAVGAWLPLCSFITFMEIRQGNTDRAVRIACPIFTILAAAALFYFPFRDVLKGIQSLKNKKNL